MNILLKINELRTNFYTYAGTVKALEDINLEIYETGTLGLVGESGCGKSVTALSIMRLLPSGGRIENGEVLFKGEDLLKKTEEEMRQVRGKDISMIFQEPMTSLNPVYKIGDQIAEVISLHQGVSRKALIERSIEMLGLVGIPDPERVVKEYQHELSGGMRQRVMIAISIACNPNLLIADEATTALDVTVQAQIVELLKDLKESIGTAILLITHNLGLVAEMADHVAVMYAGHIIEYGDLDAIFHDPMHPYTKGLLSAVPGKRRRLDTIPGSVPDLIHPPSGCRFHPRCESAKEICRIEKPEDRYIGEHRVACHLYDT
jgi:oligopeptide/dipeptide ABC transporter ATP-binding protein